MKTNNTKSNKSTISQDYIRGWTDAVNTLLSSLKDRQASKTKRVKPAVSKKAPPSKNKPKPKPCCKQKEKVQKTGNTRQQRTTFQLLGIPEGSKLTFRDTGATVVTTGQSDVIFQGKTMPLISATRILLEKAGKYSKAIRPIKYWAINGTPLCRIYETKTK